MTLKKNSKKISIVALVLPLLLGVFSNITPVKAAEIGTPLTQSKFVPTPEPSKFLNVWNTNGYELQPEATTYTMIGNDLTLNTEAGRSIWSVMGGIFDAPHYRWYKSDDGIHWNAMSEDSNGHRKNLPIQTSKEERTWYQLDTQYWNYLTGWAAKTHIYSNVAEVNAVTTPTNATGVSVSSDSDYVYNTDDETLNTTYAHAVVDPISSTGKVSWSVDNTKLATVNSNGKITANNKGLSGVVKVDATFSNMDTSFVVGTIYVRIGGGLDDQTVIANQPATFTLQGNTDGMEGLINKGQVSIEWYKKAPGETKSEYLGKSNSISYTTTDTSISDNGSQYQAKITLKEGSKSKVIKTNWATLNSLY